MALSTRLATSRSMSLGSPSRGAGRMAVSTCNPRRSVSGPGRGPGRFGRCRPGRLRSRWSSPLSLLARVRRASMRCFCSSLEASSSWAVDRQFRALVWGSSSATCSRLRSAVRGVRSSWEALATKCRCASNAAARRANRSSRVSPSRLNSSSAWSQGEPFLQVGGRDSAGGGGDGPDGSQHPAGDEPAGQEGEYGDDGQGDSRVDQELVRVRSTLRGLDGPGLGHLVHGLCQLVHRRGQLMLVLCQLLLVLGQLRHRSRSADRPAVPASRQRVPADAGLGPADSGPGQ